MNAEVRAILQDLADEREVVSAGDRSSLLYDLGKRARYALGRPTELDRKVDETRSTSST